MKKYWPWQRRKRVLFPTQLSSPGFALGIIVPLLVSFMSILSGMMIIMRLQEQHQVVSQLTEVKLMLYQAQAYSVHQGHMVSVRVQVSENQMHTPWRTLHLGPHMRWGVQSGVKGPPSQPTQLVRHPFTFADQQILFYPQGAVSPGTLYLIHTPTGRQYALTCGIQRTGIVRAYYLDQGIWKNIRL